MVKSHNQFIAELLCITSDIEVVSEYTKANNRIDCRCKKCLYVWSPRASNLLRGIGCPKCNSNRKSEDDIINALAMKNISLKSNFVSTTKKVLLSCNVCGNEWESLVASVNKRCGCSKCAGVGLKTHGEFVEQIKIKSPAIEILSQYINGKSKIKARCKIDGYEWETKAQTLSNGYGCPKCGNALKKTNDEFVEQMLLISKTIVPLEEYKNAHSKIKVRCTEDNHEWLAYPNHLLKGIGCPVCSKTGFKLRKRGWLYIVKFRDYIGFGITGNVKSRLRYHRKSLTYHGVTEFKVLRLYGLSGEKAYELETKLKKELPICSSGIEGFKTECIKESSIDLLYSIVSSFYKEI